MDQFDLVGETLRRLRKERGKTLDQLGKEAGLGRGQLSRIENGHQTATLATLAKILGSEGISRREFFRRYELVESEELANQRSKGEGAGQPSSRWPEEVQEVFSKVESFVHLNFQQPRPVAQGALELGNYMVLFRVVPKSSPEAQADEPAPPKRAAAPAAASNSKKKPAARAAKRAPKASPARRPPRAR